MMATTGWSVVQELATRMAERLYLQPGNDALHRVFRVYAKRYGLVDYQVLPLLIRNGLAVARLSQNGKSLCAALGWPVLPSDLEKIIVFHDGNTQPHHAAMVLEFAWQARRRGYRVEVMPTVPDARVVPDVYVYRCYGDCAYVEVERGRNKQDKWFNLNMLQGFAALCTLTPRRRKRIVEEEIQPIGIGGMATDLETLRESGQIGIKLQLWVEGW